MKKRFELILGGNGITFEFGPKRFDSIDELIQYYQGELDLHDEHMSVYDHIDKITVDLNEVYDAWLEGERPTDLQFF